jgi:hypothetical protein
MRSAYPAYRHGSPADKHTRNEQERQEERSSKRLPREDLLDTALPPRK